MTFRSPCAALAILVLSGCAKNHAAAEVTVPPMPSSDSTRHASAAPPVPTLANPELRLIVPASEASEFYLGSSSSATFFTPTVSEIAAFEAKLGPFLRATLPRWRWNPVPLADRMPKYMRQYVGVVDDDGVHRIWGNFFCDAFGDWRKESFVVKDGGDCYFNVRFDPALGTFDALRVNGEA
jgi:hypothetical protein